MLACFAAALAISFPSTSQTSWMDPEAFRLQLGMPRNRVVAMLKKDGWTPAAGKEPNHLIVQYEEDKTITLAFRRGRLVSARFELVGFIPSVQKAFAEQEQALSKKRGKPTRRVARPALLTWKDRSPNIDMVLSTSSESSFGRQGLGFLVVRYFVPPPR